MRSFSWILSGFLHIFNKFLNCYFALFSDCAYFSHHIFDKSCDQTFCFLICLHSWIDFHLYDFWELFSYLNLIVFEIVDVIFYIILSFHYFRSKINFLLTSWKLFLFNPSINSSKLSVNALLQSHDSFIFSLKLSLNNWIHGLITISHFISFVAYLLIIYFIFHLYLLLNLINLSKSVILLLKHSIYKLSHFYFKFGSEIYLNLTYSVFKIFIVSEICKF